MTPKPDAHKPKPRKTDLIVFTDLDGTLIDHDSYSWHAAKPALQALKACGAGVVLASSKTAAEVSSLRAELDLEQWPAIVENGAGQLPPHIRKSPSISQYAKLRAVLDEVSQTLRDQFHGFGDASAAQVVEMTGLSLEGAELAKQRDFSEPGQWHGCERQKLEFLHELKALNVVAQQGGRFLTLSFGGNKAQQMHAICARYSPKHTIALGDAPNDIQMLEHAEYGVVINNPHRPPLPLLKNEPAGKIIRTKAAGPLGWNGAILNLLDRLELN